jgi:hypothetical protein
MFKITPVRIGLAVGATLAIAAGGAYISVLREPGSAFYWFAGLVFLGAPLSGGIVAGATAKGRRLAAILLVTASVFAMACFLFLVVYAALPQFARASVRLPDSCDGFDGEFNPPSRLAYALPEVGTGILLASDERSAVVAVVDGARPRFPTAVFLVHRGDRSILRSMRFGNDVVSATIDEGLAYLYNDKLGYLLDARTGEFLKNFLLIDNYGGLSESDTPILSRASDGHWYLETAAVISSWGVDGAVRSRPRLTLNGIARGCFISGDTREVTPL